MNSLQLDALDGANPLSFLAALGLLDVATSRDAAARLAWVDLGRWRPVLHAAVDREALVGWVMDDLASFRREPAIQLRYAKAGDGAKVAHDLKPPGDGFRDYLLTLRSAAQHGERRSLDFAAAFATDIARDGGGSTKPTALHFTAGQQEFLSMVDELLGGVTADDVREALWGPWRYERPLPVLQWDASDSRDYALRASNPSKEKKLGVPGADWLAFRGLRYFPTVPRGQDIHTTGCGGKWKTGGFLQWPLWSVPIASETVKSLLQTPNLGSLKATARRARGIEVVLESTIRRSDQGGYGSFAPPAVK